MSSGTKAKPNYMLILFLDDQTNSCIDIVPHSWLSVDKKNDATYCKYMPPPYNARTSRMLQEMIRKNEKPLPTWSEYLVEIRGRAQTYEDAEARLSLLEKQPYVFTTDNEESAKLEAIKEKKSLKMKSVGDLHDLQMTLDKSTINFYKDPRQSVSPQQIKLSKNKHAQPNKKLLSVSSASTTSSVSTPLSLSFSPSNSNVTISSHRNSSSSFDSDESFQIHKNKKQKKIDKNKKSVNRRLSEEKNDINSSNDHIDNRSNGRKNFNENDCGKSSHIKKRNKIEENINKNKKRKLDTSKEENLSQELSNNEESLIINDENSKVKNDTFKIDKVNDDIIVRYFRSISKQIANLNGQVVLNTVSIELLRTDIKKHKKCSCMNESHEDLDISADNESLYKSEFTFPLASYEIFVNFDKKNQR